MITVEGSDGQTLLSVGQSGYHSKAVKRHFILILTFIKWKTHKHKGMLFEYKEEKGKRNKHVSRTSCVKLQQGKTGISSYKYKDTISHNNLIYSHFEIIYISPSSCLSTHHMPVLFRGGSCWVYWPFKRFPLAFLGSAAFRYYRKCLCCCWLRSVFKQAASQ